MRVKLRTTDDGQPTIIWINPHMVMTIRQVLLRPSAEIAYEIQLITGLMYLADGETDVDTLKALVACPLSHMKSR